MAYSYRSGNRTTVKHNQSRRQFQPRRQQKRAFGQYIDPSRFVKIASSNEAAPYIPSNTFADFGLHPILHTNLTAKGYETPSPIQDQTIDAGLAGKDVIGIANTGTGKTAAFGLALLHKLLTQPHSSALIVAPTRELALQIDSEIQSLAKGSNIHTAIIIGGTKMTPQLKMIARRPRIVIGTPGRLKDHITRGSLKLRAVDTVVLDEVDRMLDMGFVADVREILSQLAPTRQSLFFSATMEDRVSQLIQSFTTDPHMVSLQQGRASDSVHQDVINYGSKEQKLDLLHDLLLKTDVNKTIIFDETKYGVDRLGKELVSRGFKADTIHGGKSQSQRQRALKRFKQNECTILVATDVAARGIDVADISHVVNFSIPKVYDDYIHRIGRAGRAGKTGQAYTFVQAEERQ